MSAPPSDGFDLVPATLPVVTNLRRIESARPWLRELPALVEQVRAGFRLRLAPPLHGGSCSWVAPAELPDGTRVIVKIGWPHPEMYGEPAALRRWGGRGAVRLIAHDPRRHALLLRRCEPGTPLTTEAVGTPRERIRAGCGVLRQLWVAPPPDGGGFDRLGAVTARWADLLLERMARLEPGYDAGLVADAAHLLRELPASAERDVVLHGDFNPGNVLATGEGRWAAIDPKPMVGDPAYDPWPLLEQIDDPFAYPDPSRVLRERLALLADELAVDRRRLARWALARGVEWALWAADHEDFAGGADMMRQVRLLAAEAG